MPGAGGAQADRRLQRAAVDVRLAGVILLSVCLPVSAPLSALATSPDAVHVDAVCFSHEGPQDKPMPQFCVVNPARRDDPAGLPANVARVNASAKVWARLVHVATAAAAALPAPAAFGQYRATTYPDRVVRHLDPTLTRAVAAMLIADARGGHRAQCAEVVSLERRLPR